MFNNVGFIGLGLMGGSIAKSIRKYSLAHQITAYDSDSATLTQAKAEGIIDIIATDVDASFAACDLIFLCCPVKVNVAMASILTRYIKSDCLLTDIGSTKLDIHQAMASYAPSIPFIGGHPMTGSEKSGYSVSNPLLFENIYYVVTPGPTATHQHLEALTELITNIDSIPITMDPVTHDDATSAISHVPHILAAMMVNAVEDLDQNNGNMHTLAAGGFRDLTRIASGSPHMWESICLANKMPILKTLDHISYLLAEMHESINKGDGASIISAFEKAKNYRDTFNDMNSGLLPRIYSFSVDVDDEPGIIARIATTLYEANINIKNIGIVNIRESDNGVLQIQFNDQHHMEQSIELMNTLGYVIYR